MTMEIEKTDNHLYHDPWDFLRQYTAARIALGRTGVSIPLKESLNFKLAHAHARDAVFASLNYDVLLPALEESALQIISLRSQAPTRQIYLQRPDLGRKLDIDSAQRVGSTATSVMKDVVFIIADGLSALAVNEHSVPLLKLLIEGVKKHNLTVSPVFLVEQGRVAISDEIGHLANAGVAAILIGERPGLSSPDSLGVYLTYNPQPGLADDSRNCVSNIRPGGLPYDEAARKIIWLITESIQRKLSGVALKDQYSLK
jgi:ethanolamine ammonia-lyase small subunit